MSMEAREASPQKGEKQGDRTRSQVPRSINERTIPFPLCGRPNTVTRGGGDHHEDGGCWPALPPTEAEAKRVGDVAETNVERACRSASKSSPIRCTAKPRRHTSSVPQNDTMP